MTQSSWLVFAAIQGRASSKALLSARKDLVRPCLAVRQPYTSFLPFQTPLPPLPTKQSPVSCDSSVGTSRFNCRLPLLTNNPTDFAPLPATLNIVCEPSWCWPRAWCPSSSFAKMLHALTIFGFIGSPSSYRMAEFSGWLSVVSAVQFLHAADSEVVLGGFSWCFRCTINKRFSYTYFYWLEVVCDTKKQGHKIKLNNKGHYYCLFVFFSCIN